MAHAAPDTPEPMCRAWRPPGPPAHPLLARHTWQVFLTTVYYKRWKWAPLKSRRIVVDVVN